MNTHVGPTTGVGSVVKDHANFNTDAAFAKDPTLQLIAPHRQGHLHNTQGAKTTIDQQLHQTTQQLAEQTTHSQDHSQITTPVKVQVLKHLLLGYPYKKYLIDGFEHGFSLGYVGPRNAMSAPNLKSCREHPGIVQSKILAEVKAKRVKGPFKEIPLPGLKISPIGIVPKKVPGQYRLIHHLSCPVGTSVNDFIDPVFASVRYASFDDATKVLVKLGPYTRMGKTDIDSAFRLIPIHPNDHSLLGFKFGSEFYYDSCLPFGASSSCSIFEAFSSALEWVARYKYNIEHIIHILDDFLILDPPQNNQCNAKLSAFLHMCSELGVPIKHEKTEYATTCITFMGLELDSAHMEARLPQDKLSKLRNLLNEVSRKRKIRLKELQSLLGLLNFCCKVVVPGRCFLRRLYDLTKSVTHPNHRITLNKESRKDIQAWQLFVEHFNGRNILQEQRWVTSEALHFFTDASGAIGYGALFNKRWFNGIWPSDWLGFSIAWKELFPIVLALEIWGSALKNSCITLHTDNVSVVYILNRQTSKDQHIMHLVRRFVLCCMKHNLLVKMVHVPGKQNTLADLVSRSKVSKFHAMAPWMDKEPTPVPTHLLQIT